MAARLGLNAKLYRNTGTHGTPVWNEVANVKDLTLNLEKAEADVTTRGNNGWRATVGTLKDASIEFQMVDDDADDDFAAFSAAFFGNTSVEVLVLNGGISEVSEGLRATVQVLNFSRSEPLEEAVMVDVTLKPSYATYAPQWLDFSGGSSGV